MLYVVEGPDGSGKTTFARTLSRQLGVRVLVDPCRELDKASGDFRHADRYVLTVDAVASVSGLDLVLDRYWPSGVVYRRLRGEPGEGGFVSSPCAWAQSRRTVEALYFVDAPDRLILERLRARGEPVVEERVLAVAAEYRLLRRELADFGIPYTLIDGSEGGER